MLIRTGKYDEYINSDEIVRLRSDPKGVPIAILKDGTAVRLTDSSDIDSVAVRTAPVIPAAPGYEALWLVRYEDAGEEKLDVIRHPVLGWQVNPYGGLSPVTLDDETASNVFFGGVRYPDGRVIQPAVAAFKNEEDWLACEREDALSRRKPAA